MFFDIRHFSAHRQLLARTNSARPLTILIAALLDGAVFVSRKYVQSAQSEQSLLNHTGDGFVLVFRGAVACLDALRFASEFREIADEKLKDYAIAINSLPKRVKMVSRLPKLAYGIGLHCGPVTVFKFQGFKSKRSGFLGSAVNIASRVEGCTKDHPEPVLCTGKLLKRARKQFGSKPSRFDKYFASIGLHYLRGLEGAEELIACSPSFHSLKQTPR